MFVLYLIYDYHLNNVCVVFDLWLSSFDHKRCVLSVEYQCMHAHSHGQGIPIENAVGMNATANSTPTEFVCMYVCRLYVWVRAR